MNLDYDSKELRIKIDSEIFRLHPLWIRERSIEEDAVDQEEAEAAEPEMQQNRDRGKFVIILKRGLGGVWKFESFIWNSDLPLPVASLPEVGN